MSSSTRKKRRPARRAEQPIGLMVFDYVTRVMLGAWFGITGIFYFRNALLHWENIRDLGVVAHVIDALSIASVGIFSLFIAGLYIFRLQPINRFAGLVPALTAAAGTFLAWSLLLLKARTDLPAEVKILVTLLVLGGNIYGLIALRHLGRSFSIFPESRRLITTGPYHYMRHPLYVAEAIAMLGAMINFLSPEAVIIFATQLSMQFMRMGYEEKVLRSTFPEYAAYAKRTARIIPGIY